MNHMTTPNSNNMEEKILPIWHLMSKELPTSSNMGVLVYNKTTNHIYDASWSDFDKRLSINGIDCAPRQFYAWCDRLEFFNGTGLADLVWGPRTTEKRQMKHQNDEPQYKSGDEITDQETEIILAVHDGDTDGCSCAVCDNGKERCFYQAHPGCVYPKCRGGYLPMYGYTRGVIFLPKYGLGEKVEKA